MSGWIYLSFFIDEKTPAYGNGERFKSISIKSIAQGDSCNTAQWTLPNHLGTHIDCPFHFISHGTKLTEYSADFWIFNLVHLIDISPIHPGEIINSVLFRNEAFPENVELLLIKTGFGMHRNNEMYWKNSPVFLPEIAKLLRRCLPKLRAVGLDTISISSCVDRLVGREAHRAFLGEDPPILLIEDMDLSRIDGSTQLTKVFVCPLMVSGADAAPCTIIAREGNL